MARRIDRRTFLGQSARAAAGIAVAGSAGSLIAACGSSGGGGGVTANKIATRGFASTATPKLGGNLVFGVEAEETGFDPTSAHFDSTGVCYARTVYDPLAIALADGSVVPYLAESFTPNGDYTEWTITLRPNLFFHDGTPCNADALAYCFNACKASALVNFTLGYMKDGGAKKVKGSETAVTVSMHEPWVPFPAWLCGYIGGQVAYPFSPTQFEKAGPGGSSLLNSHPIGTGPFIFQGWVPNDHFTATRNPHYWRKDTHGNTLPYLDSITYKPLPIVSDRWTGIQSGTLGLIHTDDPRTILDVQDDHSLGLDTDENSPVDHDMDFGMINTTQAPFDDIRIRQAFAYGFNDADYRNVIDLGVLSATAGPFMPGSKYYAPTGYPSYNVQKAMQLVNEYKADHGNAPVTINYGVTNTPSSQSSAALISNFVTQMGMTMTVTSFDQSSLINAAIFGTYHILGWRQFANVDPDVNYPFWAAAPPANGISVNFTRLKDQVVQRAIDTGRQTTDEATRIDAYQTVAKRFAIDCPYIWVDEDLWALGASSNVQNFNNPTTPTNQAALPMISGIIWPTEIWMS